MRGVLICALLVLSLLTACSTGDADSDSVNVSFARSDLARAPVSADDDLTVLVDSNTAFAFDLYHQFAADNNDNLIFSPYSISLAFAMLYAGAGGETEAQMAQTLHFDLPQARLHAAFNALDQMLQPPEPPPPTPTPSDDPFAYSPADDLTLTIANALWSQEGFPIEDGYLDNLAQNYGAGVGLVDFSGNPDAAHQTIRQWIENATGGRISDMPAREAITPQTRLALTNAIYFKGEWTYPFSADETYVSTFHLVDDSEVSASVMVNDLAYMECVRSEGYHAIQLTYGGFENAAMLILLPDTGVFHAIEDRLDARFFQDLETSLVLTNMLTFSMPRFSFESERDLITTLSLLGMPAAFGASADFSGISFNELFIDYAGHKATISVDEQGTEATGATTTAFAESAWYSQCGDELIADRPFVFAIYDNQTGTILFLGRVMDPSS